MEIFTDCIKYDRSTTKLLRQGLQKKLREEIAGKMIEEILQTGVPYVIQVYGTETETTANDVVTYNVYIEAEPAEPKVYLYNKAMSKGKLWELYKKNCEKKGERV